jgi:hypothetical protein
MKQIKKIKLVAGWWRWVSRVESLYLRRVHRPVYQWREVGSPAAFLPRLPWWHPFVYQFLCLVGRLPYQRRLRRGQRRPVPQVRRGARVYRLSPERVFVPSPSQQQHLRWQRFLLQQELRRLQQRAQRRRAQRHLQPFERNVRNSDVLDVSSSNTVLRTVFQFGRALSESNGWVLSEPHWYVERSWSNRVVRVRRIHRGCNRTLVVQTKHPRAFDFRSDVVGYVVRSGGCGQLASPSLARWLRLGFAPLPPKNRRNPIVSSLRSNAFNQGPLSHRRSFPRYRRKRRTQRLCFGKGSAM